MRYASAYYLGLIGLLSLARAMPMNQQPSDLDAVEALLGFRSKWVVEFLEKPPPNMQDPPSTGVDHLRSVVASVSEEAKTIMKSFTKQGATSRDVVEVPNLMRSMTIMGGWRRKRMMKANTMGLKAASRKVCLPYGHTAQRAPGGPILAFLIFNRFRDAYSTYVGNIPSLDNSPSDTQRTASETYSTASYVNCGFNRNDSSDVHVSREYY
ncbi:hypothetical protein DFJ43DRAFT_1206958 [Lentinula guzmanii]|uniref:Uncharacterized protein n=1 Tax=Lentinula guzmanii TaxID=2804957 RepID=A0AA38JAY1_9AGAR|nr:hypothetical protein DFJ43DRAFT_1206958 [Lentinula guzmanii]